MVLLKFQTQNLFLKRFFVFLFVINFKSMAELQVEQPKSLIRPKSWSTEVENAYRFQLAGYRDEKEYTALRKIDVSIFIF